MDLDTDRDLKESGHLSAAAFYSHQAAEKALSGAIIEIEREMPPKMHNLIELGKTLEAPEDILSSLRLLDPEYSVSRYPDAANGVPEQNYDITKIKTLVKASENVKVLFIHC